MNNWRHLLDAINKEITKDHDCPAMKQTGNPTNLLYYPASANEIEIEEKRLGVQLPTSYIEFLQHSNGLKILNNFYWNILPWLKDYDPKLCSLYEYDDVDVSDEKYFVYDKSQRTEFFRGDYLRKCLTISEWGDAAILLLNPEIKFGEEWEAWAFASWLPSAVRYKSFWDLVNEEFKSYLEFRK